MERELGVLKASYLHIAALVGGEVSSFMISTAKVRYIWNCLEFQLVITSGGEGKGVPGTDPGEVIISLSISQNLCNNLISRLPSPKLTRPAAVRSKTFSSGEKIDFILETVRNVNDENTKNKMRV